MNRRSDEVMKALAIGLQEEVFALDAESVREIMDLGPVTTVPNAPALVSGLINVRGRIVPLADLRVAFDMARPEPDVDTRIVVIEIDLDGEATLIGVLADKVYEVADLRLGDLEQAPKVGMRWRPEFVGGIGRRGDDFVIVPNVGRIFATSDGISAPQAALVPSNS